MQIHFEDRFQDASFADYAFFSLDGTDCRINENHPYSSRYFSFKFNGPGLKYEIGVSIRNGVIVWVNGGVPCGMNDLTLARSKLVRKLLPEEKIIADRGYRDDRYFIHPFLEDHEYAEMAKKIRARHENVNARIKIFKSVGGIFRHDLHKHVKCFFAVCNIVQITLKNGSPLPRIN